MTCRLRYGKVWKRLRKDNEFQSSSVVSTYFLSSLTEENGIHLRALLRPSHQLHTYPSRSYTLTTMCYMNQSICVGCSHVTTTPVRQISARTPDLLHKLCSGKDDVVCHTRHHTIEFCIFCYHDKLLAIEAQFIFKKRVEMEKGRLLGFGKAQLAEVRKTLWREWRREIRKLDVEWEGMWCG